MSRTEYLLQVSVAATAAELHEITRCAAGDRQLAVPDFLVVDDAVSKRFSTLNHAAAGNPQPRWK
jgi:hypothetical protein